MARIFSHISGIGLYISDPKFNDFRTLAKEMRDIRLLTSPQLEKRLEDTLFEIDTLSSRKIGKKEAQGLIRGAFFAASLLRSRARYQNRHGGLVFRLFANDSLIKACSNVLDLLSKHDLCPDYLRIINTTPHHFVHEIKRVCEDSLQERIEEQMRKSQQIFDEVDNYFAIVQSAPARVQYIPAF